MFKFAVLTISDSRSFNNDLSGDTLEHCIRSFGGECTVRELCSDDPQQIEYKLRELIFHDVNCIITTGGTGFSKRDVTPEVTKKIIEKEAPGLVFALMEGSLKKTPLASLSRLTAGIAYERLIINFPGKPKACQECFDILSPILPHALQQLSLSSTVELHENTADKCCKHAGHSSGKSYKSTRESPFPMLSYDQAISMIKDKCSRSELKKQTVQIDQIHTLNGHTLAQDVSNTFPFPPFPASTRDGYAVISEDGLGKRIVLESSDAGRVIDAVITSGKCVKISTGASVPDGANAVVQIEDTKLVSSDGSNEKEIEVLLQVKPNENIRPIGSDLQVGRVLKKGQRLNPVSIALVASIGLREIEVYQKPKVAILSTGDEVIEAGEPLPNKHCIYDSNRPLLKSLLTQDGYQFTDLGIVSDNKQALIDKFRKAFQTCDIIITSGGVSMGHKDYVKPVLQQEFGAEIHFGRVDMKPGKPITMATLVFNGSTKYVFGLPGNPVSVFVCYNVLIKEALYLLTGSTNYKPQMVRKKLLLESSYRLDTRPEFLRVNIGKDDCVCTDFNQCSSRLYNSIAANGLAFLPKSSSDRQYIQSGFEVDVLIL